MEGHAARVVERRGAYRVFVGKLRERGHLEDSGIDGRIRWRGMQHVWWKGEVHTGFLWGK